MIKINLLGDDTATDSSGVLWLGGFAAVAVVFLATCFFITTSMSSAIAHNKERSEVLKAELTQLKKKTKEVRDLEKKKKELNEKLAIIARLKKNQIGPVRVLDDLNVGIPERAWLTGVKEKSGAISIQGFALDNQTIATFMRNLSSSDYFDNVDLVETKKALRGGTKIKQFVLQTKVNYAGKVALAKSEKEKSKKG